jgi:hypothetical protein
MATLATVLGFSRAQSQTDSNGLTDANGLIFANEALLDFRRRLISAGVDAAQVQEAYRDMVANTGTYLWPSDMWWNKAIELGYGGGAEQGFIRATQADVANLPNNSSFGWLRSNAPTDAPYFDDRGDWYEIFPTPQAAVTGGIRIVYFLKPTEFTATTDTISYPESLDYRVIGLRIAANYKRSLLDFESAAAFDGEYEKRCQQIIATLSRGTQQPIQAAPIMFTGWEF